MKASHLFILLIVYLCVGCGHRVPQHYDTPLAKDVKSIYTLHTVVDTIVAKRPFRIYAGIADSAYKVVVEYNSIYDTISNPFKVDTFGDGGILTLRNGQEVKSDYRFINDSMVIVSTPTFVYQKSEWKLYKATAKGMKQITGGMSGPYPIYLDETRHRIIDISPLKCDDPDYVKFYREIGIRDYLTGKYTIQVRRDKSIYFDDDYVLFYKSIM